MSDDKPRILLPQDEPGGVFGTYERLVQTTDHPADQLALGDVVGITPEKQILTQTAARDVDGVTHSRKGVNSPRVQHARTLRGDRGSLPPEFEGTELSRSHSDWVRIQQELAEHEEGKARKL